MPFVTAVEQGLLGSFYGKAAYTAPTTTYVGLLTASTWVLSTVYSTGAYVVPTTFNSITGPVGKIFKATTGGTSSGTQPTWPTTAGGTVSDGSVVWTEVSTLFAAGTFTSAEPSGGAYARVAVTNNTTNWPTPTGGNPATSANGTAVTFPTTTASWGQLVGFLINDSSTAGTYQAWAPFASTSAVATVVGVTPAFAIGTITDTLL